MVKPAIMISDLSNAMPIAFSRPSKAIMFAEDNDLQLGHLGSKSLRGHQPLVVVAGEFSHLLQKGVVRWTVLQKLAV
jgi:hypothetical protein